MPVKNAADEGQVREAEKKAKLGREQELADMRKLLATDFGRRFVWRVMSRARVFESIWEQSAKIHYNAGQQDFGHFIMAEVVEAGPEHLLRMMQEAKQGEQSNA